MENPYFVKHDSALLDVSLMEGQEVLNFGSYNYVAMSGRPEVQAAAKDAIDKYGTSASGSRLLAGEKTLYQELERELADWKNAEAALILVSGHATNVTLVGNFCGKDDLILYDALAHNSIDQGTKLSRPPASPSRTTTMSRSRASSKPSATTTRNASSSLRAPTAWTATSPTCPPLWSSRRNTAASCWWTRRTPPASSANGRRRG